MSGKHVAPPTILNSNREALSRELLMPVVGAPDGYSMPFQMGRRRNKGRAKESPFVTEIEEQAIRLHMGLIAELEELAAKNPGQPIPQSMAKRALWPWGFLKSPTDYR